METFEEQIAAFPVTIEIPVQWGEMDAAGHVSNVIYLRWFEAARVAYLDALEQDVVYNDDGKPGVILAKQDCKYLFPLHYPDTVICSIRVDELLPDRFNMHCKMFSKRHRRLVALANGMLVTYDYHRRTKAPVPAAVREKIRRLEGAHLIMDRE